ncbi:MAG: phosphatase PAP2 family protein [Flavobacteriales bacterium]|nr:phosphatase PAP2 family protein [Flavobacteriales bacterium]
MIEFLEQLDRELFLYLNGLRADFLDRPMWVISQIYGTLPLMLILLYHIWKKHSWQLAVSSLGGIIIVVSLADRISVELFKEVFQRFRPTHNLEIKDIVNTVKDFAGVEYRGGKFSFVSSHATNFFGLSSFYWQLLRPTKKWIVIALFAWAGIVSYSRIYLGVHYPSDIFAGAALGLIIGWASFKIFDALYRRFIVKERALQPKTQS